MSMIIVLLMIGVSLSMDTISVALSLGTFNISKVKTLFLSVLVGIMHFFMPLFGIVLGKKIITFLNINVNFLLGIILLIIGIEMILNIIKREDNILELSFFNMFLVSVSVSLDSFSTGLGLNAITDNFILSGVIFSICATLFTFFGLIIGKYSSKKMGIISNIIGIIILLTLGIVHIFK